jgi:hypothetical protein
LFVLVSETLSSIMKSHYETGGVWIAMDAGMTLCSHGETFQCPIFRHTWQLQHSTVSYALFGRKDRLP